MRLTLGVLADAANTTPEGKINLLGEFNVINAPTIPYVLASFALIFRLEAEGTEGAEHNLHIRLLDEDGDLVRPLLDAQFTLSSSSHEGIPRRIQVVVPIQMARFDQPGTYTFDVLVDNVRPDTPSPIEVHVLHVPPA